MCSSIYVEEFSIAINPITLNDYKGDPYTLLNITFHSINNDEITILASIHTDKEIIEGFISKFCMGKNDNSPFAILYHMGYENSSIELFCNYAFVEDDKTKKRWKFNRNIFEKKFNNAYYNKNECIIS
jgi:hypothetical protein